MGFNDFPKVDDSSKRCENSELAIRNFFKRDTGFVCRTETPDYGADFDIELITEDENVSGFKFAVQAKSSQEYKRVRDSKFISYSVETSRIGYLSRRTPGMGFFILYEQKTGICFYDFVENIVERIINLRPNDDWKNQGKVSILIPVENTLDVPIVNKLHNIMTTRRNNHNIMLSHHAENYNLPFLFTLGGSDKIELNLSSPRSIELWLETYGYYLINEQNFSLLSDLISQLSLSTINKSKKLLIFALFSSTETLKYSEANSYLAKVRKKVDDLSSDEVDLYRICEIKINTLLGKLSLEEATKKLSALITGIENPSLKFSCEMSNMKNKLLLAYSQLQYDFSELLEEVFEKIDYLASESIQNKEHAINEESKHYFLLSCSDYLLGIYVAEVAKMKAEKEVADAIGGSLDYFNIKETAQSVVRIYEKIIEISHNSINYAKAKNNNLVLAYSFYKLALQFWSPALLFNFPVSESLRLAVNEQTYNESLARACTAYNIFLENNNLFQAYNSIILAYEICALFQYLTGRTLQKNKQDILEIIHEIEDKLEPEEIFSSKTENMIQKYEVVEEELLSDNKFVHMTDEQLERYAQSTIHLLKLPQDRYHNILKTLKDHKRFEEINKNPSLSLNENTWNGPRDYYSTPTKYRVYDKTTNAYLDEQIHYDIEKLISYYNPILNTIV